MTVFSTVLPAGRKRRGEGHTRREEILQAAKELFLEQGYDSTTIRRIADRVGISAPALYLYFKDKEALMLALRAVTALATSWRPINRSPECCGPMTCG